MPTITQLSLLLCLSTVSGHIQSEPSCSEGDGTKILLPQPEESSLYWECWNGIKTLKTCPDGLWFQANLQTCVDPQNYALTADLRCENVTVDFFPDTSDCSHYIECYNGDAYLMTCPIGTWFSPEEKTCVDPELSGCTLPPVTPMPSMCDDVPTGEIVLKKCACGCQFYWRCHGQSQTLEACPFLGWWNVFFDEERQFCSIMSNSDCNGSTGTPAGWTPTHSTPPTEGPIYQDPRCKNHEGAYYSHPINCSKYIECAENENSVEWDCPRGLYFSAREEKCVMPKDSDCTESDWRCVPGVIDFFRYPPDCSKYIQCYDGSTYLMACPEFKWFSEDEKKCVEPEDSGCFVTSTVTTSTVTTPATTTMWASTYSYYVCGDVQRGEIEVKSCAFGCSTYWQCNGNDQTLKHCRIVDPSDNLSSTLYFDPVRRLCGATVSCDGTTATPWSYTPSPTISHTLPDFDDPRCENYDSSGDSNFWYLPGDCRKFIECYDGPNGAKGYERECPEGFYFSLKNKGCVPPQNSDCKG